MKTVQELVGTFHSKLWNAWDDTSVDEVLAPDFAFRGTLGTETHGPDGWPECKICATSCSRDRSR